MTRTTRAEMSRLAAEAVAEAAAKVGLRRVHSEGNEVTAEVPDGCRITIEVTGSSVPSPAQVREYVQESEGEDRLRVLVADKLLEDARRVAEDAGWGYLDRRGRFRLVGEGVLVDTGLDPMPRPGRRPPDRQIAGRSGIAVALALLIEPDEPPGVREIARRAGLSAGGVSQARSRLVEAALIGPDGVPLLPELFWALAEVWGEGIERVGVGRLPGPRDPGRHLELGLDDLRGPGWAVAGATAAIAWGAPLVQGGSLTVDLYASGPVAVRRARRILGDPPQTGDPPARIAPAPALLAVVPRYEHSGSELPVVHPVVAALDLALDPGRGREALEAWNPPEGFVRVW